MTAEDAIAALDDGGENTVAEVRQALLAVLERADAAPPIPPAPTSPYLEDGEPQHEDGDNFAGGTLDPSWTETRSPGAITEVSAGAWRVGCSTLAGSSSTMDSTISKPVAIEVGQAVIGCFEVVGFPFTSSSDAGVRLALRNNSGHFVRMWIIKSQSGAERLLLQSNTGSTSTILDRNVLLVGRRFWMAIKREAATTWSFWYSLDGRVWIVAGTGSTVNIEPTEAAIEFAAYNQAAIGGACYFFDIVDTVGAVRTDLFDEGGIRLGPAVDYVGNPIAQHNTGQWNTSGLREIGNVLHDPTTGLWVACYTGVASGLSKVGLALSPNGFDGWVEYDDNPITGDLQGEDPYLAKNLDGTVYRDAEGRALLFCEAKAPGIEQDGIDLWRSEPFTLAGWERHGRVLDKTAAGWASQDVSSPVVFHDGDKLVMLFEGRATGQAGQIGVVHSFDDGETWSPIGDPIIVQGAGGTWNDEAVVPDDVIVSEGTCVLLMHGSPNGTTTWWAGRYSTTDTPDDWDDQSFTEMAGNPFHTDTDTVMCWGNNPGRVVRLSANGQRLELVNVYQ